MVTKIVIFILIFSILNVLREGFLFYKALRLNKLEMTRARLIGLGLSIAYIFTIIFTGIGF